MIAHLAFFIVLSSALLITVYGLGRSYIDERKRHDWRRPLSNGRRPK